MIVSIEVIFRKKNYFFRCVTDDNDDIVGGKGRRGIEALKILKYARGELVIDVKLVRVDVAVTRSRLNV